MSGSISKILINLAASSHNNSDLYKFLSFVESEGARNVLARIDHVRSSPALKINAKSARQESKKSGSERRNLEVAKEVENLLIHSAGLEKKDATRIILAELSNRYDESNNFPSYNKVAFRTWLARLADSISPSELLHISSRVRNDIVHKERPISDWPLED